MLVESISLNMLKVAGEDQFPNIKKFLAAQERRMTLAERFKRAGIDPTVDRWSKGVNHHPKSNQIVRDLAEIDLAFFNDYFCWKVGGDGDNGETLMYELDLLMELYDFERAAQC